MKNDLQSQLTGWGIWLETVEISEVKICSNTLFEDLQAEFRQNAKLKAQKIINKTNQSINEKKMNSENELIKLRTDVDTQRQEYEG